MKRQLSSVLVLSFFFFVSSLAADDPPRAIGVTNLQIGMTDAEVQKHLGRPTHRARQILYRRYLEQWVYDRSEGLWLEFDCLKGQDPRLVAVHAPAGERGVAAPRSP